MIRIDNNNYDIGIVKITRKASQNIDSLGTTLDLRKHYDVFQKLTDIEKDFKR